jgi:hypothetical protein
MRNPAAGFVILLAAPFLAACGEYAGADWPDLTEGFEFTPTKPEAAPAPQAPPAMLAPAEITEILAETRARFTASKTEIAERMAEYEAAFTGFEAESGEAAERAWLSVQLALSRVSQAADGLTLVAADLRRAEAEAGKHDEALRELLAEVEAEKAGFDQMLIAERQRLEARRPG